MIREKFESFVVLMILISIVAFSLETVTTLTAEMKSMLQYLNLVIVVIFSFEYLYRVKAAERWQDYVFSFYGIIDLAAILPFYIATSLDLRSIRIFRLLRVLRILKLARYNAAIARFRFALSSAKEELILFIIISLMVLYLAALGIYYFERDAQPEVFNSLFNCLWWALSTLTTVGYGDIYPVTVGGRVFTFLVLIVGLGLVTVPAAIFATALSNARKTETISQ